MNERDEQLARLSDQLERNTEELNAKAARITELERRLKNVEDLLNR